MRRSKTEKPLKMRGDSLVEVLVAIAVFALVCTFAFGLLLKMTKLPQRQEESVRAEMLCRDIALCSDMYGKEWIGFFDASLDSEAQSGEILLGADFKLNTNAPEYKLTYSYTASKELTVSILHIESGREIVSDFNYGNKRYTK